MQPKEVLMRTMLLGALALVLSACATQFTGDAHVEGGPSGCEAKCRAWGQEFVGMVAMGEYSDACICHVPGKPMPSSSAAASVVGGVAGVAMQTQRSSSAAQQQQMQMQMTH
jgi:hypothetical protein